MWEIVFGQQKNCIDGHLFQGETFGLPIDVTNIRRLFEEEGKKGKKRGLGGRVYCVVF